MIDIKLVGHDYDYDIREIIGLFFDNESESNYKVVSILKINDLINAESKVYLDQELISEVTINKEFDKKDSEIELRKQCKRLLKISLFKALKKVINKDIPWGILTGIRPTKIVHEMLQQSVKTKEILDTLTNEYEIREDKARLLIFIANKQLRILNNTPQNSVSLYIGIPFCPTRCLYCSFTSNYIKKYEHIVDDYLNALFMEMESVNAMLKDKGWIVQTIYIGGGTPTTLSECQLDRLLTKLENVFDLNNIAEITLEAGRPDTITKEKLELTKQHKVNRISINPQTMNQETLEIIKRMHSPEEIINAYYLAKEVGFSNINMDIIAGLPQEQESHMIKTMEEIFRLEPDNLTVHTMAIKRASDLNQNIENYRLTERNTIESMLNIASEYAYKMNMYPYYLYRQKNMLGNFENVGYCKPNKECIYNIQIMEEKQTIIALGAGGISKIVDNENNKIERIFNVKNVEEYIGRINEMIERKKKFL